MDEAADEQATAAMLAVLLRGRCKSKEAAALAGELMDHFGGLRPLLEASARELRAVRGMGPRRLEIIRVLPTLAARYFAEIATPGEAIRCPADTERFLAAKLSDLEHELFCCLFLDNRHRVLAFEPLFRGTIDGTSVYPREVVKEALAVNAAAVILAHNHPSGVAEPSQADERITRRLKAALELVDIRLLDHFVVGRGAVTSLASRGLV